MDPRLIGYECKRTAKQEVFASWLKVANVEEIGSVSGCISEPPKGEIDWTRINAMWLYSSPEDALAQVPVMDRNEYDVYAYKLSSIRFDEAREVGFLFPMNRAEPLDATFEKLGYDAVCGESSGPGQGNLIECSPLSCNGMARERSVNRHCLVDTLEQAVELARECSREETRCEKGVYSVFEVWRRKR